MARNSGGHLSSPLCRSLRQRLKCTKVAADQCFFLGSRPAFDLPFRGDGIGDPLKPFRIYKRDGTVRARIASEEPGVVFRNTPLQSLPRSTAIIAAISTLQETNAPSVTCYPHRLWPSFETPPLAAPQDEVVSYIAMRTPISMPGMKRISIHRIITHKMT